MLLSPLEKGVALHLKKNLNPLHPRMLCAKFGWNWPSGFSDQKKIVYRRSDRQTDDGHKVSRKVHLSFQFRWAKKKIFPNMVFHRDDKTLICFIHELHQSLTHECASFHIKELWPCYEIWNCTIFVKLIYRKKAKLWISIYQTFIVNNSFAWTTGIQ